MCAMRESTTSFVVHELLVATLDVVEKYIGWVVHVDAAGLKVLLVAFAPSDAVRGCGGVGGADIFCRRLREMRSLRKRVRSVIMFNESSTTWTSHHC